MDKIMVGISTPALWAWFYILMFYLVYRNYGWRGLLFFVISIAIAVGLGDMITGIFKHTGLLKNLWESFPARLRPMYTPELEGLVHVVKEGGRFGTVSGHAATMASIATLAIPTVNRRWFTWSMVVVVLLICYSRIYLAYHFPVDIALGMVTGLLSGGAVLLLFRWMVKKWCK
jgi:undecaprenyl-diphosphatase